jgi:hypothetical protein
LSLSITVSDFTGAFVVADVGIVADVFIGDIGVESIKDVKTVFLPVDPAVGDLVIVVEDFDGENKSLSITISCNTLFLDNLSSLFTDNNEMLSSISLSLLEDDNEEESECDGDGTTAKNKTANNNSTAIDNILFLWVYCLLKINFS